MSQWIERIRDRDMPTFGHTVQQILRVTGTEQSSASQLAEVLLQDVSMTTRVLKLANSVIFNAQQLHVSTVSRAVITLGFNTIRDISLSVAMVDSLVSGRARDQLVQELALSIHAATQARELAALVDDPNPEEVFITVLLHNIGELCFWSFAGDVGDELLLLMRQPGYTAELAQQEILGFKLSSLGSSLRSEWSLEGSDIQQGGHSGENAIRKELVTLSLELANKASTDGWNSNAVRQIQAHVAKLTNKTEKQICELTHSNARDATQLARYLGASGASKSIPLPERGSGEGHGHEPEHEDESGLDNKWFPKPDGALQLKILRELSQQIDDKPDFSLVIELALEGIYRGVGTDRCVFAMITPDRKGLRAKAALGQGNIDLKDSFQFLRQPRERNIFFLLLERPVSSWIDVQQKPELKPYLPTSVTAVIGNKPFMVAPVIVKERVVGLIYADRALSGRELDHEAFESFSYFVKQASLGLTVSASRHPRH